MRFISGFQAAALAGALMLLPGAPLAQGGGFGGGGSGAGHGGFGAGGFGGHRGAPGPLPGYGANAYAPGQGNTGAAGWNGGNWRGFTRGPFGYFGGGYGGGYGGDGVAIVPGPSANVFNYNYNDYRRRDGGFYGGGGVFYGDDGYSRLYSIRPPGDYSEPTYGPTGYAPYSVYRPSQHIFYLPDNNPRGARKAARHAAE
ncbi:hypothetical protein [Methylocystis iwaonis]|uniref:BA14K family protein n=1 Tax=Methylocystis iwaonis TaxID=2885079 RepID=A0ABN6VGB9_9HYPH|nr:hypothetical protein [Methylocystis iwaonis]BDV34429.1 hypothetical protein SS37A_19580 [Methylocystis iwaonis]